MENFTEIFRDGDKMIAPPADGNKHVILDALRRFLRPVRQPGLVLEVSSGTGQHVAWYAPHLPDLTFLPTDFDNGYIDSIRAHTEGMANVKPPQLLDAAAPPSQWLGGSLEPGSLSAIININMIHISSQKAVDGLFAGAGVLLSSGGRLITHGPYAFDGVVSPGWNAGFDQALRSMNPDWGLRDVERDLKPLAARHGLSLVVCDDTPPNPMPADAKTLVWQKA